jgi:hypothetical protein
MCYCVIVRHLVSWLLELGRRYVAIEMRMISQLRRYSICFQKDSNIWQMASVSYENLWHNNVRSVVKSQL